jgi:hypothetical protein
MITRRAFLIPASLAAGMAIAALPLPLQAAPAMPVLLYKSPGCGCCEDYGAYLEQHGFKVTIRESDKLAALSANAGVPAELQGCHTAFIGGYVVDGHVPIEAVEKLLAERSSLKGLAVPGMPPGSPGMPGTKEMPLVVYAIGQDGKANPYMTF